MLSVALTLEQIDRFTDDFRRFAETRLKNGPAQSVQDLVDLWRIENPSPLEMAEARAAVKRGIEDAQAGRMVSVEDAFAKARKAVLEPAKLPHNACSALASMKALSLTGS
jgi:hypothetical protein